MQCHCDYVLKVTYQTHKLISCIIVKCSCFCFCSDGPYLRKLHEVNPYEGVELSKERIFVYAKKSALQEIISAISKRFSEFCDEPAGVVTATRIADMKAWPISWDALKGINLLKIVFKNVSLLSLFLCF